MLTTLLFAAAVLPNPTEPAGDRPAYRAEDFIESIGLCSSPFETNTQYAPEDFFDLGVRYYRNCLRCDLTNPRQPELMGEWWRKTGARPMLIIDAAKSKTLGKAWGGVPEDGDFTGMLDDLKRYEKGLVAEIECPNEINNKFMPQELDMKYKGAIDEAAGALYQRDIFAAIKGCPWTKDIPVVMHTVIFSDYALARPCDAFDFINVHSYQGDGIPSSSLMVNFARAQGILPPGAMIKPYVPTECGYNVELDKSNGMGYVGSLRAQAYNEPMLLAEYFRHGIRRSYLFSLPNVDGYGLLESDSKTRRPAWYAIRSLIGLLFDSKWDGEACRRTGGVSFQPRVLRFSVEGVPDSVHTLTLQKENGDWYLLVWNEVRNRRDGIDAENPEVPATIRFLSGEEIECTGHWRQGDLPAKVYEVLGGAEKGAFAAAQIPAVAGGAMRISVPSRVTVYRLRAQPRSSAGSKPPQPALKCVRATENEVELGVALPEDGQFASVMLFRNDMHCRTVSRDEMKSRQEWLVAKWTDATAWIRPALGYRYRAVAVAADGTTGPVAEIVATTPDRVPDLVVDDINLVRDGEGPLAAGETVRLRGTIANRGDGATPHQTVGDVGIYDSSLSVTFSCEGRTLGWGGNDGSVPLAPGGTFSVVAGGPNGGRWTLTPGTHVVMAFADDVNRICSERDEYNNVFLKSFTVGEHPGALALESRISPWHVDLSREGTIDWVCFNSYGDGATPARKRGADRIRFAGKTGEGFMSVNPGCRLDLAWGDDGTQPKRDNSHEGYWGNCIGNGYRLEVPAGREERTLKVWAGVTEGGRMELSAKLSDGSAPEIAGASWNANRSGFGTPVPGEIAPVYELRYRAAKDGEKLTVELRLAEEPHAFRSQIRLQAAALK